MISACLVTCNLTTCASCGKTSAKQLTDRKGRPEKDDCGEPLPQGGLCRAKRTKIYYRCKDTNCQALTVKNVYMRKGTTVPMRTNGCLNLQSLPILKPLLQEQFYPQRKLVATLITTST
jgi:hypothetical protein